MLILEDLYIGNVRPGERLFKRNSQYAKALDETVKAGNTEISLLQNLIFTMLMDFCGKVREMRKHPSVSLVTQKCLNYISVHLHETITLDDLCLSLEYQFGH